MLWLEWEGGQLPIGWDAGPSATIPALFGTSWKVYTGVNTGNGMTVVSLSRSHLSSTLTLCSINSTVCCLTRSILVPLPEI